MRKLRPEPEQHPIVQTTDANVEATLLGPSEKRPMFLLVWDPELDDSVSMAAVVNLMVNTTDVDVGFCTVERRGNPNLVRWLQGKPGGGPGPELYVVINRRSGRAYTGAAHPAGLQNFLDECLRAEAEARQTEAGALGPVDVVVATAAASGHPMAVMALSLMKLVQERQISEDDLEALGLTTDELTQMRQAFEYNATLEDFEHELETYAKLRTYRRQIQELGVEIKIANDPVKMEELQHTLVEYALENEMRDLKKAFRLLRAEHPERIPTPSHP